MAAYLSPIGNEPQIDANGDPLSGGKIYTYVAGSSTPAATYTSSAGVVAQANPILLNSRGVPANPIWIGGGQSLKFVLADANDVTLAPTFDGVTGINDPSTVTAQDQWVALGITPTYLSATSFSVAGDQTPILQVGRRLKSSNSGGTIYSSISSASFGAGITTVFVVNDSGTLDSGLSAISYGLLSVSSSSTPAQTQVNQATSQSATGTAVDFTGIPSWVKRITIVFSGVTTNGTSPPLIQIGDSGGPEFASYAGSSTASASANTVTGQTFTTGFGLQSVDAAASIHGVMVLANIAANSWVASGAFALAGSASTISCGGSKTLSSTLDRVRITTVSAIDTYDGGTINILFE
jgi:hypothetical protein